MTKEKPSLQKIVTTPLAKTKPRLNKVHLEETMDAVKQELLTTLERLDPQKQEGLLMEMEIRISEIRTMIGKYLNKSSQKRSINKYQKLATPIKELELGSCAQQIISDKKNLYELAEMTTSEFETRLIKWAQVLDQSDIDMAAVEIERVLKNEGLFFGTRLFPSEKEKIAHYCHTAKICRK